MVYCHFLKAGCQLITYICNRKQSVNRQINIIMKKNRFLSLVITFVMSTCMYALEVGHLKTQAYTNPIGIDLTTPSFSWVLSSSERNVMQTSYSIRVSTERDFSDVVATVWSFARKQ